MFANFGAGEDSWESLGQQGDQISQFWRNQPWIYIGRNDAEAEDPILWPHDVKSQLTEKDPDAGKDWGQENGATEDEMVGWHHLLSRHGFEKTLGDSEGQGSLVCSVHGVTKSVIPQSDWTTTTLYPKTTTKIFERC